MCCSFRRAGLEAEPDLTAYGSPLIDVAFHEWLGLFPYWAFGRTNEAYAVDSGPSICSRRGAGDRPARLRGLSRLMMSQYPVGSWWMASPSSASEETWR
jgi:hypothetical protein